MKQVAHKLGSGQLTIEDVPAPDCRPGMVIIRNHFSVISAGSEGATIRVAKSSVFEKAARKPQEVRKLIEVCKMQGVTQAYRAVMKKLDAYAPLGYSSAGEVLATGPGARDFAAGDFAAAAGAGYANHAELVSVPANLCVKLAPKARLDLAAYNTLGAIALQGIRQADPKIGETCVVIGLGLIGQLTCLMLRAGGIRAAGVDVDRFAVEMAARYACDAAWVRSDPRLVEDLDMFTDGLGADSVIVTAGSSSLDPINFAGKVVRKRGRVVVVGAVPTGFDREPDWYRKELELRMSCSYGPGRYDPSYEEKGIDYPAAYVRWSEKRNMAAFQDLIHRGRIDIEYLTTHKFAVSDAARAYELVVDRTESFLGILIEYSSRTQLRKEPLHVSSEARPAGAVCLAFIGAGSYAQSHLLPNLPKDDPSVVPKTVLCRSGASSKRIAEKYRFELCVSDSDNIFNDPQINTVFVATRHDSHAEYVLRSLVSQKHVFVEKPLALTEEQLESIVQSKRNRDCPLLMVGYNRRFSPLAVAMKQYIGAGPMSMLYRVNAGRIPVESWIHDFELGGGRIVGEVCHFVDFLSFACGSLPVQAFAAALPDAHHLRDTVNIQLTFENGSIGTIAYYANGSPNVEKEYIEVYSAGVTAVLRDFRRLDVSYSGKHIKDRRWSQDKGQLSMLRAFLDAISAGKSSPIPFEDLRRSSVATFAIMKSLASARPVNLC